MSVSTSHLPIVCLAVVLLPVLLSFSLTHAQFDPYRSSPLVWYTFDSPVAGSTFAWSRGVSPHEGRAELSGVIDPYTGLGQYVDLLTWPDDYGNTTPLTPTVSWSVEFWAQWNNLNEASSLFACGTIHPAPRDSLYVGNQGTTSTLQVLSSRIDGVVQPPLTVVAGITPTTWQHIVVSTGQYNQSNIRFGTIKVFINGVLKDTASRALPNSESRTGCWIGRSITGGWLSAYIDDFFYYNYPLSGEAALAHMVMPRPPVYELTFNADPRLITGCANMEGGCTYEWKAHEDDGTEVSAYHDGHLDLTGDQYADLSGNTPAAAVGTTTFPIIGGISGASNAYNLLPVGWSIEVLFKPTQQEDWAKVFCFGNGPDQDNIILGYEADTNPPVLQFELWVNGQRWTMAVDPVVTMNVWHHVVITWSPQSATVTTTGTVTSFVNGGLTGQQGGVFLPKAVPRQHAYLGRSEWPDPARMDMVCDTFRIYDYALTAAEVFELNLATRSPIPTIINTNSTGQYHSGPSSAITFAQQPSSDDLQGGSSFTWLVGELPHKGLAAFNGNKANNPNYINLAYYRENTGIGLPINPMIGGPMTIEAWVRFNRVGDFTRIVDFAYQYSVYTNSIVLANEGGGQTLMFEVYVGTQQTKVRVVDGINLGQWQHIVATIQQNALNDTSSASSATYRIYINGRMRAEGPGFLPYVYYRESSWIGKSNYAANDYFNGTMDAVYIYDYALQYEQVAAHYIVLRPPLFELAFTEDPRIWLQLDYASYAWQAYDPADQASNNTQYHNGHLWLEGDSFVDLTTSTGPSSIGTTLPTTMFTNGYGSNLGTPAQYRGFTFELLVKIDKQEDNVNIFDFGNGEYDTVALGYYNSNSQLNLKIRLGELDTSYLVVVPNTQINTWYHIVIVASDFQPDRSALYTAYINGEQGEQGILPRPDTIVRHDCWLGKSNTAGVGYFDMKLDTFRYYDYALQPDTIEHLYDLTHAALPGVANALYTTAPLVSYSFDRPADAEQMDGGTSFTFLGQSGQGANAHYGIASFNGTTQSVNLMTYPDDHRNPFPVIFGNKSYSWEVWVRYQQWRYYSHIFDFGNTASSDNVLLGNVERTNALAFHLYYGNSGVHRRWDVSDIWRINQWQHIVVTVEDRALTESSVDYRSPTAGLYNLYVNGVLNASTTGYIPQPVQRNLIYLAKSHWVELDELFRGDLDSFYMYDYALGADQVAVHYALPKPPVFDLSFNADPRLLFAQSDPTLKNFGYSWEPFDPADAFSNNSRFHTGSLVLDGQAGQYVDLSTPTGINSVGVLLPQLGGVNTGIYNRPAGWSFEFTVKISTAAIQGKLIDWGNGFASDNIIVGYESNINTLVLTVYNSFKNSPTFNFSSGINLIQKVELGQWYHIVIVMSPDATRGDFACVFYVYVNGAAAISGPGFLPQYIKRRRAYIGRSFTNSDAYFSAKIDTIRVFDYALSLTQAGILYRIAHDPAFVPAVESSSSSTGRSSSSSSVRSSSSSTSTTRFVTSPGGDTCEYGTWPNCICPCGGYYPYCQTCQGVDTAGNAASETITREAGLSGLAIAALVFLSLIGCIICFFGWAYWKRNGCPSLTGYSYGGGNGRNGVAVPSFRVKNGLLSSDEPEAGSKYDWQAYRRQEIQNNGRGMDMSSF